MSDAELVNKPRVIIQRDRLETVTTNIIKRYAYGR